MIACFYMLLTLVRVNRITPSSRQLGSEPFDNYRQHESVSVTNPQDD